MRTMFVYLMVGFLLVMRLGSAALGVVLVAVFAVIFLRERPSAKDWLGIVLVTVGVLTLAIRR